MSRFLFSPQHWLDTAERAVKTAAQAVVLALGQDIVGYDVFQANWKNVMGSAAGGALLSVLTSIISAPIGPDGPSVT